MATLAPAREAVTDRRRNRPDVVLLFSVVAMSLFGLLMIYSATRYMLERSELLPTFSMERQMIFVTVGLIALFLFSLIDYRDYRAYLGIIYVVTIVLLIVVFFFPPVQGGRRWIPLGPFNFQPGELAKLVVIITTAHILSNNPDGKKASWSLILKSGLLVAAPFVLIFLEPDLGTTLVLPFVWMVMVFASGAGWKQILGLVSGAIAVVAAAFQWGLLREHQLNRIAVFIDPSIDPQGIGYQLRQSKLAIGSGQLFGKGLFQGTQTNLSYVPEQDTDFIFSAVGEQLGLFGATIVLIVFLVIVWRILAVAANARDRFGGLIAVGIAAMILFHVFVNVGMTIGIAPVTGLPLPFLSQGGSFYLAMAIAIGIVNSIWLRRSPVPGQRT